MAANLVFFFGELGIGLLGESEAWARILLYVTVFPVLYYFVGRVSLVCPALAVDWKEDLEWSWRKNLEWSWEETNGHGWKMVLLVGGVPIILGIVYEFLALLGFKEIVFLDSFLQSFLWFFFTPIEIALVSIVFRELTHGIPATLPTEAAATVA